LTNRETRSSVGWVASRLVTFGVNRTPRVKAEGADAKGRGVEQQEKPRTDVAQCALWESAEVYFEKSSAQGPGR